MLHTLPGCEPDKLSLRHIAGPAGPPKGDYDADVVILSLDRADETVAAIRSALAQSRVSRHVFIVDQGSRPEALTRLAAEVAGRQDATLVALDRNHGVAGGRNRGSSLGHGRVIFGLDNDAEFADVTTLARAVAALDEDRTLAAIGCRILLHACDTDDLSSWGYPSSLLPRAGESFDTVTFVGAGHAIRRAAWDGYDEALFFCWEEFDFCLRAIEHGWRIRYRGDIAVRHKVSPEQRVTWSGTRWFHFVRNRLYIERKWGAAWLALLPRIAFYLVKGARNRVLMQTVRAAPAAIRLSSRVTVRRRSPAARRYLRLNDAAYRGHWVTMLWRTCRDGFRFAQPFLQSATHSRQL
ncbi:MAG TPA: glycosyltransferase family 2 protein [Acetobacteraceae bacterium]|nr:glycosyltransferase family 2 protein [Acetobacteraceae bacterium]